MAHDYHFMDLTTTIMSYTQRSCAPLSHHITLLLPGHDGTVCGAKCHATHMVGVTSWDP